MSDSFEKSSDDRLEIMARNMVQVEIIKLYHEKIGKVLSHVEQGQFMAEQSPRVREIIDNPDNEEIRRLALDGKYREAAELVFEKLDL